MRKVLAEEITGGKVYFTEADACAQMLQGIRVEDLVAKLKLWMLLSDNIMVAGSHIFESAITARVLKENPKLLEKGVIIPAMRDECADYTDFLRLKLDERDAGFVKINVDDLRGIAGFLNQHTHRAVRWSAEPARESFRQSLLNDLLDHASVLRRQLGTLQEEELNRIAEALASTTEFSRQHVEAIARRYLGHRGTILVKYANLLYYLWGAAHLQSEPVLQPELFMLGRDKLTMATGQLVRTDESPALASVLDQFCVSTDVLDRLSLSAVLILRDEAVARNFRVKWQQLVQMARTGRMVGTKHAEDFLDLHSGLKSLLGRALQEEQSRRERYKMGRKVLSTVSFITSGITAFYGGREGGWAAFLLGLATIDPFLMMLDPSSTVPGPGSGQDADLIAS